LGHTYRVSLLDKELRPVQSQDLSAPDGFATLVFKTSRSLDLVLVEARETTVMLSDGW